MILVVEGVETGPVVSEPRECESQGGDVVEVERQHEQAVLELVFLRGGAVVDHGAFVEAGGGMRCGGRGGGGGGYAHRDSPVSARHARMAEVRASSWKPYLK